MRSIICYSLVEPCVHAQRQFPRMWRWVRTRLAADNAVHCEPVSAPNSHASCPPNIWALAAQSAMACGAEACPRSRLDDAVPEDHPMREIAAVLDLLLVYSELASYYPRIGRPMFSVSHSTAIIIHHGTSSRS